MFLLGSLLCRLVWREICSILGGGVRCKILKVFLVLCYRICSG